MAYGGFHAFNELVMRRKTNLPLVEVTGWRDWPAMTADSAWVSRKGTQRKPQTEEAATALLTLDLQGTAVLHNNFERVGQA